MSDVFKVITVATGVVIFIGFFLPRQSLKQQAASADATPRGAAGVAPRGVPSEAGSEARIAE
jgi:hypothetical protein